MKVKIFDLEFDTNFYYIQKDFIVDRVKFNNRTLYSKFKKIEESPTPLLITQHIHRELTVALPLIEDNQIRYIVLEYKEDKSDKFYYIIRYILKSLPIDRFHRYKSYKKNHIQIFIETKDIGIDSVYDLTENIQNMLDFKSSDGYKIFPNKNLPKSYNKIVLPIKKM